MKTEGIGLVDGCAFLARRAHGDQRYGDHRPYTVHLEHVVAVMRRFLIVDEHLLGAGWLHDSIEDTELSKASLVEHLTIGFGQHSAERVGVLVDAVTDGEGKNRRERKERPYELIPTVKGAILVKLADRIANVEAGYAEGQTGLIDMYRGEFAEFHDRLYDRAHAHKHKVEGLMWAWYTQLVG